MKEKRNPIVRAISFLTALSCFIAALFFLAMVTTSEGKSEQYLAPIIELTPENTVTIRGEINHETISNATFKFLELRRLNPYRKIYIVIDSPGGMVQPAIDFIGFMNTQTNYETISIFAASAAAMIMQLLETRRNVTDTTAIMFHEASITLPSSMPEGQQRSTRAHLLRIIDIFEKRTARKVQIPFEEYKKSLEDEIWMYGTDIISAKAGDRLISLMCSPDLIYQEEVLRIRSFIFIEEKTFSACPLIRQPKI